MATEAKAQTTAENGSVSTMNPAGRRTPAGDVISYDHVTVSLVPEKKGVFLKHSEYEIRCLKQNYCVYRRYNDFATLQSYLLQKYPFRLLPRLPPKQLMLDSLLEERRRGLQIWLKIVSSHPVLSQSLLVRVFLTENNPDVYQDRLRAAFNEELDEFQQLSEDVELPLEDQGRLAVSRENMRAMLTATTKLKKLIDNQIQRTHHQGKEMGEISNVLRVINGVAPNQSFSHMSTGFQSVSEAAEKCANLQTKAIGERLNILLGVLHGHSDLCDRVEKGIVAEHQKAMSKMLVINKQKMKGVIRGTAGTDTVNSLHEREVQQTGVVGTLERRSAFGLYSVFQETSLVQQYLQALPSVILSFCNEQQQGTGFVAHIWEKILFEESQILSK